MGNAFNVVIEKMPITKKSTVKPAASLKSLNELKLSKRTQSLLRRQFGSIEEVVRVGRALDYYLECTSHPYRAAKWELELVLALKNAGFIRPWTDFALRQKIGAIYYTVYMEKESVFLFDIESLSSEEYENFQGLTDEEISSVMDVFRGLFTDDQHFDIFCRRHGLLGKPSMDVVSLAKEYGVPCKYIERIERNAIIALVESDSLPVIFGVA